MLNLKLWQHLCVLTWSSENMPVTYICFSVSFRFLPPPSVFTCSDWGERSRQQLCVGCSCDTALPCLSLSRPAALGFPLIELSAIPAIVVQQLRPHNMKPFIYGSVMFAVVRLYYLQQNSWFSFHGFWLIWYLLRHKWAKTCSFT